MQFATCERNRALGFLQKLYPGEDITDTEDSAKAFLDLVAADIVRVPDPYMHGPRVAIYPSTNWDETKAKEYKAVLFAFHEKYK